MNAWGIIRRTRSTGPSTGVNVISLDVDSGAIQWDGVVIQWGGTTIVWGT